MAIYLVRFSNAYVKSIRRVPQRIRTKADAWILSVGENGLEETMKLPGYHDEPLRGTLHGKRSVRLSRSYRLFYRTLRIENRVWIEVLEVNHHVYS